MAISMKEYWNKRFGAEGEIWGKSHSRTAEYALELFKKKSVTSVLVPGSGYGRNAELFHAAGLDVEGIELSDEALKIAQVNNPDIRYSAGSVLDMPFSDKKYDAIYCFNVLHLFREGDRKAFIDKCFNQLSNEGFIFFTVFSEKEKSYGKGNEVEKNTFESKPGRPVHYFTEDDLVAHFEDFTILVTGLTEDPENHGDEGSHTHVVRYIFAQKKPSFEFDGQKYKEASKHQKEWGNKIISEFNFRGDESILDLGCGDGVLTAELASLVPDGHVLGIDASQGMITAARVNEAANLSYMVMDISHIDFEVKFDLAFSNATLHWVKDHKKLMRDVYAVLKPGGVIRFNFAGDGNCSNFNAVVKEVMVDSRFALYFKGVEWPWYMPGLEEYKTLVAASNFREVRVWGENADRYFASADEMVRWIDQPSLVPFLKEIGNESDKKLFRDTVVEKMIEITKQDNGTYFVPFRRINVFGRK